MDQIIAGRFPTKSTADDVAAAIYAYMARKDVCIFHNNPPGQHGTRAIAGDEPVDPVSDGAAESAVGTAAAAGLAAGVVGLVGGPVVALAAAGVGAYTGSLVGALNGLDDAAASPVATRSRPAGVILAVRIDEPWHGERVINDLQLGGAVDIERANGHWEDGDWTDFNPAVAPQIVAVNA